MDRRGFIAITGASIFVAPTGAATQQPSKVYRIGALREGPDPNLSPLADAMRELGWIEGQNFRIERRSADGPGQFAALAAELVASKVDLIFTAGTGATQAAKEATKTIPIVFIVADDPVVSGLAASFARPGGNLTGFAIGRYDEKLLEILKETFPLLSRVAFPAPPADSPEGVRRSFTGLVARLTTAAQVLNIEIRPIELPGPKDFDRFFLTAKRQGANAALVPNFAWFRPHLGRIGVAAAKSHSPAIGYDRQFAESGGLLAYGPTYLQNLPRLAALIDKILKGAKPADLPVE